MSSGSSSSSKPRMVKLLCPQVSKVVPFMVWDDQKLDLGSIARVFGLDPSTLKLNGHYISRGVDFVSSSVTWRSLLNFFSAKRLSTGEDDKHPLVVDGKLCRLGTKRSCDPQDDASCKPEGIGGLRQQGDDVSLLATKKLKESNSGSQEDHRVSYWNCKKRKPLLEDVNLFKKLKINEANPDFTEKGNQPSILPSGQFKCAYTSDNAKQTREEAILAAPCKKIK